MQDKKTIRKTIIQKRKALNQRQIDLAEWALYRRLYSYPAFLSAKKIATYLALDGEASLNSIIDNIWLRHRACYLPILTGLNSQPMRFGRYHINSKMQDNRFRIQEPAGSIRQQLSPKQLDLVLMPLVAFDLSGNRLGMGGGFYDRSFSFLRRRKNWRSPRLIGVAYDFQEVEQLPIEKWDVPMDAIITPTRLIEFNRS